MLTTIADIVTDLAQAEPDRPAFTFLAADRPPQTITAAQLGYDAGQSAAALHESGVQVGDLLLLLFDHGYELLAAFCGALLLGAVPAIRPWGAPDRPAAVPPRPIQQRDRHTPASSVVTGQQFESQVRDWLAGSECRLITLPPLAPDNSSARRNWRPDAWPDDIAYLQYGSGTTGQPKGVKLTHAAILHYLHITAQALALTPADVIVGWLPLYHDMGLMTQVLQPLYSRLHSVLIRPSDWLSQPHLLLQAVDRYRGSVTWMPNFALRYCVRRVRDEQLADLDLSPWRIVGCSSELVQAEDLEAFADRFAPCGLRRGALTVAYGLAEHVAGATTTPHDQFPAVDWVNAAELTALRAIPAEPGSPGSRPIVSCGYPKPTVSLRIADPADRDLADRELGQILLQSPSLFAGYHLLPDESAQALDGGWLHTGDIGYLVDGQLYACGRQKDLIIVGGRNVEPGQLELIAEEVAGRPCRYAAAFGVPNPALGTEMPVVVCEMRQLPDSAGQAHLAQAIRAQVRRALQLFLAEVYLVEKGWIPKTTSGKIRRSAARDKYLAEVERSQPAAPHTPPPGAPAGLTATQQRLLDIWQRLLRQAPIGLHDDFFQLGGDSLLAIQLALEIEDAFQVALPPSALLESPTVSGLAHLLDRREPSAAWETLVAIQPVSTQSGRPILFCVHGLGGGVLGYQPLSLTLGPDQPFYGLQARGLDGSQPIDGTIEAMAAHYLQAVRLLQPHGPFYLAGYCFGGVVAYEMAQQLTAAGEAVALVAILEGYAPGRSAGASRLRREWQAVLCFVRDLPYWLSDYLRLRRVRTAAGTRRVIRIVGKRLLRLMGFKVELATGDLLNRAASLPAQHQRVLEAHLAAIRAYSPAPIACPLVLFRTPRRILRAPGRDMGWAGLSNQPLTIEMIAGRHGTILEPPDVQVLADRLRPYLTPLTISAR